MADIFISYAHEDQSTVRRMVSALESEGFSVWWDHNIPPGKTWSTHIALGLQEAKACIVAWSKSSIESKWVLEEASIAGDAEKLLPVLLDSIAPPLGFRRLQAAPLSNWRGEQNDPAWRLLVSEARRLVEASGGGAHAARPPVHRSPVRRRWLPLAGAAVALAAGMAVVAVWPRGSGDIPTPPSQSAEAETERSSDRERDAVLAQRSAVVASAQPAPPPPTWRAIAGDWRPVEGNCSLYWRFVPSNGGLSWRISNRADGEYQDYGSLEPHSDTRMRNGAFEFELLGETPLFIGNGACRYARMN